MRVYRLFRPMVMGKIRLEQELSFRFLGFHYSLGTGDITTTFVAYGRKLFSPVSPLRIFPV